ncbi:hypothetical protein EV702DRAFT_1049235 [Suillus placidus]|uniref:RPN1 N-terminal domain-containing protein n=1 Tax=Suillus placidus TaxID=48579 RepID=A0A9P6ZKZ2_9AGAM|nr:hypothetical protein EV702DRAFT_1049235 [Suillus placidus]
MLQILRPLAQSLQRRFTNKYWILQSSMEIKNRDASGLAQVITLSRSFMSSTAKAKIAKLKLKRLDDKMILTEVHLLESRVYRGIGNLSKSKYNTGNYSARTGVGLSSCTVFADIFSVLVVTYSDTEPRGTLRCTFCISPTSKISGCRGSPDKRYQRLIQTRLNHSLLRSLTPSSKTHNSHNLSLECTTFFLGYNAEPDIVDLLVKLEIVDRIANPVDANAFGHVRVHGFRLFSKIPETLGVAIRLIMTLHSTKKTSKPLSTLDASRDSENADPKSLEDVYKNHLETTRSGLLNASVRTEADTVLALLAEHIENSIAYVGSHCEDLLTLLLAVADDGVSMEITAPSTLALGFVFVGSSNGEITSMILQTLTEIDDMALDEKWG